MGVKDTHSPQPSTGKRESPSPAASHAPQNQQVAPADLQHSNPIPLVLLRFWFLGCLNLTMWMHPLWSLMIDVCEFRTWL